jgi:RNA polymerase sigma factor (sigma-70 family)
LESEGLDGSCAEKFAKKLKNACLILLPAAIKYQMPDVSDINLLQDYNRHASEEAFGELVRRHVNLVYSTALRHAGIPSHAEEIAQAVFVILARKAGSLRPDTVLEAWLYETTRLTCLSYLRGERRRQFREQEAYMQSTIQEHADPSTWSQFAPLLDDAMARLGKKDREAVVLRFFKEKNLREVAIALNVTEAAAQSRVHRALEKLRRYFSKRGVVSTTAIIANEISAHSVHAAPAGLAKTISAVAVVKGATASASTVTLIKGVMKIMAWTKMKTAIIATAIVLLAAAGTTTVIVPQIAADHQNDDWRVRSSDPKYLSALPYRTLILPTKAAKRSLSLTSTAAVIMPDGRAYGVDYPVEWILCLAYFKPEVLGNDFVFSPARTILNTKLPTRRYDFFSNWPTGAREALQAEIQRKFGLSGDVQPIATNALLLEVRDANPTGLEPQPPNLRGRFRGFRRNAGGMSAEYITMDDLARRLEQMLGIPVINQTGLTNRYGFTLSWNSYSGPYFTLNGVKHAIPTLDRLKQALPDQLGLELVPTNMPVQMLVVGKAD